jgi:hypothetical protein
MQSRVAVLLVAFLAVAAGAAFIVVHWFLGGPPVVDYASGTRPDTGAHIHVLMQEDPQNTVSTHPDWVSYFIHDPASGTWKHTTLFSVPAGSLVTITVLGYDGCTPLRNPFWGKVTGTIGGVAYVDAKPVSVINSYSGCNVAHTFSIPALNVNVPMASPGLTANLCGVSPCTSGPHVTETFSFRTPRHPGVYIWQCRDPCGGGFIDGFGGPMQTIGFMTGTMQVVS